MERDVSDLFEEARALEEQIAAVRRDGAPLAKYDGLLRDAQEMIARQRAEIAATSPLIEAARRRGDVDIDALVSRLAPIFNRKLRERA